jgi:hypothetical protein
MYVGRGEQMSALLGGEPVSQPHPDPLGSLYAGDAGGEFGAEQAGIGGLVGDPPNGCEAQIDRRRGVQFLFEKNSVSQDYGAIERQAGL